MHTLSDTLDAKILNELKQLETPPSLVICVRNNNQTSLFHKTYGKGVAKDSIFLIASQSKTFTAASALQLIERKELQFDDRLIDLLPGLQKHPAHDRLRNITIRDLLEHRSGLEWKPEIFAALDMGSATYPDPRDLSNPQFLNMLDIRSDNKAPSYSNASYALLGAIIERAACMPYGEYVTANLLEPHGLTGIHPSFTRHNILKTPNIVQGHYKMNGEYKPASKPALDACIPSGGIYATAQDVSKFYHLLLTGQILSAPSLDIMRTQGMGLVHQQAETGTRYGHAGFMTGYESLTSHNRALGTTTSLMSNICTLPNHFEPGRQLPSEKESGLLGNIMNIVETTIVQHGPAVASRPAQIPAMP